ncbi:MAG: hypothetical protein AB7L84_04885 [Acidimicrobiia bacterium]
MRKFGTAIALAVLLAGAGSATAGAAPAGPMWSKRCTPQQPCSKLVQKCLDRSGFPVEDVTKGTVECW